MPLGIFDPALSDLAEKTDAFWGPQSFQDYLTRNKLPKAKTAQYISVNSLEELHPSLRDNDVMALRLGASKDGAGTQFGLVKVKGRLSDFFLIDSQVFEDTIGQTFLPPASYHKLYPFQLIPSASENSLVNYAFASGIISHALQLDKEQEISAPATGTSTYTFTVRPHSCLDSKVIHNNGQVQIDALFVGQKQKKQTLFVLEAKSNVQDRSLAKHKLIYPILAIANRVPPDMTITPVYMKVTKSSDGLHFLVAECTYPDPRATLGGIDELKAIRQSHLVLPLQVAVV